MLEFRCEQFLEEEAGGIVRGRAQSCKEACGGRVPSFREELPV